MVKERRTGITDFLQLIALGDAFEQGGEDDRDFVGQSVGLVELAKVDSERVDGGFRVVRVVDRWTRLKGASSASHKASETNAKTCNERS